jgi:hypothetical protein
MINLKRALIVFLGLTIASVPPSMTAERNRTQLVSEIASQLQKRAQSSSNQYMLYMLETPLVMVSIMTGQMTIPPQRRQYLDLAYIQSVAPAMNDLQAESLKPLAKMLRSSNAFERESVTELINFEPEKHRWTLTPEFSDTVARQITCENVTEIQYDLFSLVCHCKISSATVLHSLNDWARDHSRSGDFTSTSSLNALAQVMTQAPSQWSYDADACLKTIADIATDNASDVRYKAFFAIEGGFKANPDSAYTDRLMDIVKTGIQDTDASVATTAIKAEAALGAHASPYFNSTILPVIEAGINRSPADVFATAMEACADIGSPGADAALPYILRILEQGAIPAHSDLNQSELARKNMELWSALVAAGGFGRKLLPVVPSLEKLASSPDNFTRVYARKVLAKIK